MFDAPRSKLTVRVRRDLLADKAALRLVARGAASHVDPAEIARISDEIDAALALFGAQGWLDNPATYHQPPSRPDGIRTRQRRSGNLRYTAMSWPDHYAVRAEEPGAARFAGYRANGIVRAALLEHRSGDRPWLVCVHGFGMGSPGLDLRAMRGLHLFRELGINVAFITLPFHGRRNPAGRGLPAFPGPDVLDNVHGLAQAVWDVRQLLSHLRSRSHAPIGVMGLSLGGCVAASVASLDDVDAALLLVPVADLGTLIRDTAARFGDGTVETDITERAVHLLQPVSPLALTPRVAKDRRFLVAGTLDQFVRPSTQALALWQHWDQPAVHWYHGGHVSLFWARGVQDAIDAALRRFFDLRSP